MVLSFPSHRVGQEGDKDNRTSLPSTDCIQYYVLFTIKNEFSAQLRTLFNLLRTTQVISPVHTGAFTFLDQHVLINEIDSVSEGLGIRLNEI